MTGAADDPHPDRRRSPSQNAAFTVEPTGVSYTQHATGKIDLQPDRVHIDQITVLDNHQNALSITGDLGDARARRSAASQIYVNADDFKVIDNKMGNVRINSDLRARPASCARRGSRATSASRPAQINLDPILALVGDSAYATQADRIRTTAAGRRRAPTQRRSRPRVRRAARWTCSSRSRTISSSRRATCRRPGAPIGLGALNLTLGGDLRATKEPGEQIALVGAVNTVRGTYDFQGRRFDILRDGTVRFEGPRRAQPDARHPDASA